jgi:hypothetical protein
MAEAAVTNRFTSYDMVGIREDLEDIIYDVSPEDTPLYSKAKKIKATNTYHEWQTDTLRSSAANANVEGYTTEADARTATSRLGNYSQIFKNACAISGTDMGLKKAGRADEMAYQVLREAKAQKLDIEKALFDNNKREAGSTSAARELAGLPTWLVTNTDFQAPGTGTTDGADPTGDGTDARTDASADNLTAFGQTKFDAVMQSIWENGGKPNTCYLSAFQMNKALGFSGNNNQRNQISSGRVENYLSVYLTPWGSVTFQPSRENRSRDVFILQDDMISVAVLRPTKNEALAKNGDAEVRQIITELTLVVNNEAAHGGIYDNTTS